MLQIIVIEHSLIQTFGYTFKNSDGKDICVKDICEQHILEDFGMRFIPTAQDYLENMEFKDWMQNGIKDIPSSYVKLKEKGNIKVTAD
jgi:hypothetical protein